MYENVGLTSLDYIEEILHLRKALADVSDECSKAYDKIANFEQQRWVSVKDRLPDKDGFYLAYYTFKDGGHACDLFYFDVGSPISNAITHWMPLPQKPESEGAE